MSHNNPIPRRVTIRDVAKASGVATTTVSVILNERPEMNVLRKETRDRVRRIAAEMGYRALWQARSLATGRTNIVGVLYSHSIPDSTGIYNQLLKVLDRMLQEQGYTCLYVSLHSPDAPGLNFLRDGRIDACVIIDFLPPTLATELQNHPMPRVLVNCYADSPSPKVLFDDAAGAAMAVDYLAKLGHRKIVYIQNDEVGAPHSSEDVRRDACVLHARQIGIECQAFRMDVNALLEQYDFGLRGFTAVIGYSDREGVAMLAGLHRRGLSVPGDVSILSFNDIYPVSLTIPPLTTIEVPGDKMGKLAAELLLEQLQNGLIRESGKDFLIPERLIVRESTGPAPL